MGEFESRYKIEQLDNGFIIRGGEGRIPTHVSLCETGIGFCVNTEGVKGYFPSCSLVHGSGLVQGIAEKIMARWKPKTREQLGRKTNPHKIKNWAISRTATALAKRIKGERLRLLEKVDPQILAIQKAVFAVNGKSASEILNEGLYTGDKYYLKDILQYRAAAATVNDDWIYPYYTGQYGWKSYYLPKEVQANTSLNKTLTKLPGCIPMSMLKGFKYIKLERPIYSRRELVFLLGCVRHQRWKSNYENVSREDKSDEFVLGMEGTFPIMARKPDFPEDFRHILMHANADEITRAAKLLSQHTHNNLNMRKAFDVEKVAWYVMDAAYEVTHNGNLVGLMEKSIEYHRQQAWRNKSYNIPPETETALPPIPLPTNEGVHFLKTVGEIYQEGELQSHCISSYAQSAVNGTCYLFHINHNGTSASVQVDATGKVVQSYGPYNSTNKASKWGQKMLNKWGKKIKIEPIAVKESPYRHDYDELDDGNLNDIPF